MKVELKRFSQDRGSTLGLLLIDGVFQCFTLEDVGRPTKIKHETRIPAGEYEIKYRTVGGFHSRYSRTYGSKHYGMLELQNVPNYEYILIHIGNFIKDTSGCILVGMGANATTSGNDTIGASKLAYEYIYPKIAAALNNKEKVTIKITDEHN